MIARKFGTHQCCNASALMLDCLAASAEQGHLTGHGHLTGDALQEKHQSGSFSCRSNLCTVNMQVIGQVLWSKLSMLRVARKLMISQRGKLRLRCYMSFKECPAPGRTLLASQTCRPVELVEPCGAAASSSASQPSQSHFQWGRGEGQEEKCDKHLRHIWRGRVGEGARPQVTDVT